MNKYYKKRLGKPEIFNEIWDKQRKPNMNFGVFGYGVFIGETIRLDEAIQLLEKNWDIGSVRLVDYKANTTYLF